MRSVPPRLPPTARLSTAALPPLEPGSERWPGHAVTVDARTAGPPRAAARARSRLPRPEAGTRLYVRHTPAPPTAPRAVLVHGLGGSSTNWTDFAAQLAGRVRVEALDLPGFGRAGPAPDDDYSISAQVQTLIAYLEHSARQPDGLLPGQSPAAGQLHPPVHLVGNSMGGLIAVELAAARPDLVATLTLISAAVPDVRRLRAYPLKNDKLLAAVVVPGLAEYGVRKLGELPPDARVRGTLAAVFADPANYPPPRVAQDIAELAERAATQPWAGHAMLAATRALARVQYLHGTPVWRDHLPAITAPALVVGGAHDRLVAPDLAHYLARAIADARLLFAEHVGHVAMMEDPALVARAFLALLEDTGALPAPARPGS